mgnify:FL=1|jgi:hypothetical protein
MQGARCRLSASMEGLRIYNKLAAEHFRYHAYTLLNLL